MTIDFAYEREDDLKTFRNTGDLIDNIVLTKSINLLLDRNIDLRRVNFDKQIYINVADEDITPDEINDTYNSL